MTDQSLVPAGLPVAPAEHGELAEARQGVERLLRGALSTLDALISEYDDDIDGQVRTHLLLAKIDKDIKDLLDQIAANVVNLMPAKLMTVDGVGVVEKKRSSSRRWDHDEMWKHIARLASENPVDYETGEKLDPVEATVRVARRLLSPGQWRVTAVRDAGIPEKNVSEVTWGKQGIMITAAGAKR